MPPPSDAAPLKPQAAARLKRLQAELAASADGAAAAPAEAAPAEPEMIEVWRPGRPPGERRRARASGAAVAATNDRARSPKASPRARRRVAAADGQAVAADATPPADGERKERHGRPRHRRRNRGERKDGDGKVVEGAAVEAKAGAEQRHDRPARRRQDRPASRAAPSVAIVPIGRKAPAAARRGGPRS